MKCSNAFSGSRIVMAPVFFVIFFLPTWFGFSEKITVLLLIPLFIFLEFTDFLDGYFARKLNEVTDFGKHFDPFCDALANLTILMCFVLLSYAPVIFFLIIMYREFGITFLRMIATKQGIVIPAKMGGKVKTVMYIVSMGFSLLIRTLNAFFTIQETLLLFLKWTNYTLYIIAVLLSVVTFVDYQRSYKKLIESKNHGNIDNR
ncbi:MAG: CDP-diacylglycerol--glycerol-3-phosphate 3-phosphatidyltransferase [Treponema sp.]|nr:MAG: CDP-diacylglycerol--glycerol-3-phosphate 3-phosphatidyltransferase [Treponema sp.]